MRSEYLRRLLKLIADMKYEYRQDRLDMEDKALMRILNIVLTAYWFFQVDALWMHIAQWNLRINPPVLDDALELAKNFLNAELESIAAAEAEADEEKAG